MSAPRLRGALAAAALAGLGCSVPLDAPPVPSQVNRCTESSTCGESATCVQGTCVAKVFDLRGLLLEVRPHANASYGATTSFIFDLGQSDVDLLSHGADDAPFLTHLDLPLPAPFSVTGGRVRLNSDTQPEFGCNLSGDNLLPAHLTFFRVPPFAGLPLAPIPATTTTTGSSTSFNVDLVPGVYDVYVEPQAVPGCNFGNPYPPALFTGQQIGTRGAIAWELPELPPLGHLTGQITGFDTAAPTAWTIATLEPNRGLPISANGVLTPITDGNGNGFNVSLDTAWQDLAAAPPIFRLMPGAAPIVTAPSEPTGFWSFAGSLGGGSQTSAMVSYAVDHLYAAPIPVTGQIRGTDGFTGVGASLTIQSTSLPGFNAQNAALTVRSLDTDAQGNFVTQLPAGSRYQFRAVPVDDGLAITDHLFEIPNDATCFCGQSITLRPKVSLGGVVRTPTGDLLTNATVNLTPAILPTSSFWQSAHTLPPIASRATTTTTDENGRFTLLVDSGSADLTIQASANSSFPWRVKPGLTLKQNTELSTLALTSPAILTGAVADPSGMPTGDAEVNAWFPVRDASKPGGVTGAVVKIATTTTDENGGYTLLLPSSL